MTNWVQVFTGLLFYACWDAPSEKIGLRQLPIVASVLKPFGLNHKQIYLSRIWTIDLRITMSALYQLNYLALCWGPLYFVIISVLRCQAEAMQLAAM